MSVKQMESTMAKTERVMSLSEIADYLGMLRPNVRKFLERRGIKPRFTKSYGDFWSRQDIERVKRERDADEKRMEANRKRSATARAKEAERSATVGPLYRVRGRQLALLHDLAAHPVSADGSANRAALRRLEDRGLVERVPDAERVTYQLTALGRDAVTTLDVAA